jgi:hypothetical protein
MVELATTTPTPGSPPADDLNAWADYWRYEAGLNTIPAHTSVKKTSISWKEWQTEPIPEELHEQWKQENKFARGLAIIPGEVWRGEHAGKYLIFIDCDNLKAIEEFCTRNDKTAGERIRYAKQFLGVLQTGDDQPPLINPNLALYCSMVTIPCFVS